MRTLLLIMLLSLSSHATDLQSLYDTLKYVETNNRELAVGDNGKAFGVVQIHKICIDDVNRIYGTTYSHSDAFQENCAQEIFKLYLTAGIKRFELKYKTRPTDEQVARMWNGGIYTGFKRKSTLPYLYRYRKFRRKLFGINKTYLV